MRGAGLTRLLLGVALGLVAWLLAIPSAEGQAASATRNDYYVSPSGEDRGPGTLARPFRTVRKGVSVLEPGDRLTLRRGVYVEQVAVVGKHGTEADPIVIRSFPGETASIDGTLSRFRRAGQDEWVPARQSDPDAHPDEYVSSATFANDPVNRGAFLDRNPYTRLISYGRIEDLRAENQTFTKITDPADPRPGPVVTNAAGQPLTPGYRHPWVYMGPGLWFDTATGKVHVRLSHTRNSVPSLADYTGPVDPRTIGLALSPKSARALRVRNSEHVRFERLTIRHGGDETVHLEQVANLTFDHVRISAASRGVRMNHAANTTFRHCRFSGGVPTWYFRSDRKSEYHFRDGGRVTTNNLGKQTVLELVLGGSGDAGTKIHHSEFVDGHDLYLVGKRVRFHHNFISNLNDEALLVDAYPTEDLRIHDNVVTRALSGISFAGAVVGGQKSIYRNLFDLRAPTAGYRPREIGDTSVWRFGSLLKSNAPDGPYDLFQNTFLVSNQDGLASYLHYRDTRGHHRRRSFNNIFVAVSPDEGSDRPITFVPPPTFPGPTDGNAYFRLGHTTRPAYRHLPYELADETHPARTFASLPALRASSFFEQSKRQYAPGYEAHSIEGDPRFRQLSSDGAARSTDDLRLSATSPARRAGVTLPDDLKALDTLAPVSGRPDIGAYPAGADPLRVGVDGRRAFPDR